MKYSAKIYAQSLSAALDESPKEEQAKIFDNFIKILQEQGDILLYPAIEKELKSFQAVKAKPNVVACKVARQVDLDGKALAQLKSKMGGKVDLEFSVDEDLIGGIVVKYEDTLIDASIKKQLQVLKKVLIS